MQTLPSQMEINLPMNKTKVTRKHLTKQIKEILSNKASELLPWEKQNHPNLEVV